MKYKFLRHQVLKDTRRDIQAAKRDLQYIIWKLSPIAFTPPKDYYHL